MTATLCRALVDLALDEADRSDDADTLELGVSSVLIGATGDQGLSLSASVQHAIVTAVRQANRELGEPDGTHAPVTSISPCGNGAGPRRSSRSVLSTASSTTINRSTRSSPTPSCGSQRRAAEEPPRSRFDRDRLVAGPGDHPGGRSRRGHPAPVYAAALLGEWQPRWADDIEHDVEVDRLQRLLGESVIHPRSDSRLHAALFELLFPNELKRRMSAAQDLLIEVDDAMADLPWEMLLAESPGSDRTPLVVREE